MFCKEEGQKCWSYMIQYIIILSSVFACVLISVKLCLLKLEPPCLLLLWIWPGLQQCALGNQLALPPGPSSPLPLINKPMPYSWVLGHEATCCLFWHHSSHVLYSSVYHAKFACFHFTQILTCGFYLNANSRIIIKCHIPNRTADYIVILEK